MSGLSSGSQTSRLRAIRSRSEEHTSELQSPCNLVCRLLLEKKKTVFATVLLGLHHGPGAFADHVTSRLPRGHANLPHASSALPQISWTAPPCALTRLRRDL